MRLEGSYAFDATLRLRETPTNLPKLPKLLSRNAEYAESAENNVRGRRALQSCFFLSFLGFKIPRQQSPPTYLKVAHNTE